MKQAIRAFAVGLFTAAVIMLIINYFNGSKQEFTEMPIEDVIDGLKEQGYRVLTETEYITLSMNGEVEKKDTEIASSETENAEASEEVETTEVDEAEENNTETAEEENQKQETVKTYTLTIESGMPSSAISNKLEENGIIDDAGKFISYLEDEGYAIRIQLGEFTLKSDMSYNQIAEALTR
jgi:hypothetical protein